MFLRNGWYTALWSHELTDKPVGKTFLNEKVVLFRNASGEVGALEDCCCHRAAPLSMGEVAGEISGLRLSRPEVRRERPLRRGAGPAGGAGRRQGAQLSGCTRRTTSSGSGWATPDKADTAKIPDMPWLSDPKWAATPGRLYVKTNYQFILDNLLDLTHVAHVHKKTIAGDPREATTPTKTERLQDGVRVGRWMLDFVPPPLFAKAGNFTENVDRWQHVTWHPPGVVYLDVGCAKAGTGAPQGDRSQGISIWSSHLVTPETEHTSHYMFGFARDFKTDDPEMSKMLFEGSRATFLEDVDFLEAVQGNRVAGSLDGLIHITADAAQLQARRMLGSMIEAEQGR